MASKLLADAGLVYCKVPVTAAALNYVMTRPLLHTEVQKREWIWHPDIQSTLQNRRYRNAKSQLILTQHTNSRFTFPLA